MEKIMVIPAQSGNVDSPTARAVDVDLLTVGSIEPGIIAATEAFHRQSGNTVRITFANTPAIRKRMAEGVTADVVIAPPEAIDDFAQEGKVIGGDRIYVARVGVGVMVREGAPVPDISSADALRRAILLAESVVYNWSSSGLSAEAALAKLGILDQIGGKTARYDGAPGMMAHMINGKGRDIGFGAIFEIRLFRDQGVVLVGPLPPDIQNYTSYMAAPMVAAHCPEGARTYIRYLAGPEAQALFVAHGVG